MLRAQLMRWAARFGAPVLFSLCLTVPALAAPAFVQANYATPQTPQASVTVAYAGTQTAGNLNVVVVGYSDGSATIQSVSDMVGNVYRLAVGPTVIAGVKTQAIYYSAAIVGSSAGSNRVTVTFGASVKYPDIRIAEYSGVDPANAIDVVKGTSGNSTTSDSGTVTTTSANALLFSANLVQTVTTAAGTGYTKRIITQPDGDILQDRTVAATGSYSATASLDRAGYWIMQLVAFRAASGSGSGGSGGSGGGDTSAPTAPGGLNATATSASQINLAWSPSSDNVAVTGYLVERCSGASCSSFSQVTTVSGTSYSDSGLAAATTYQYRVRAKDAANNLSSYSSIASAATQSASSPPPTLGFVQASYATPQTPQSVVRVTFSGAQSAGNLNVVAVGWSDSTSTIQSVVDQRGNAYQLAVGPASAGTHSHAIYYAANIGSSAAGTNVVTVTFNAAVRYPDVRIAEYKGVDPVAPIDTGSEGTGSSSLSSSGAMTTRNANDLLVSANVVDTVTSGPGSGFTSRVITQPDGSILQDSIVTSVGTYTATAPLTSAGNWVMQQVAFRASGSGTQSPTVPASPGSVSATAGDTSAAVTWNAPYDGNSALISYTVTASPGGITKTISAPATGTTLTGLTNGTAYTISVFATNSVGNGPSASAAPVTPFAAGPSIFPTAHSANQRYLVDHNGVPFPILGRASWFVISLSPADYQYFVDDTAAKGFNAIEINAITHHQDGNHPPFDGLGNAPFLKRLNGQNWDGSLSYPNGINNEAPDFTTPNPAYWANMDNFLTYCESKGLLVLFFPSYVGWGGGNQGFMQEMIANGATRMQTYGAWIANRYANRKNIVWMAGGDLGTYNGAADTVENALITGVRSVAGQSTDWSAEWDSNMIATDQSHWGALMTLNGVYSWEGDVNNHSRRAYSHTPAMPSFLLEEPYDEEGSDGNNYNPNATQPVRRFQWWGMLGTIGGYMAGNGYVWPFSPTWKSHMNTQGARDMAQLNAFMRSIPWYELVPSGLAGMKNIVTAGGSTVSAASYVAAAATPSGSLVVAYVPPAHSGSITLDMSVLSGTAAARWFNPTTGASTNIGTFGNSGTQSFSPPGNNGTGYSDWVLVLQKQ